MGSLQHALCTSDPLPIVGAVASSIEANWLSAAKAIDGNTTTRWSSQFSDPQWLVIDLGAESVINRVMLSWETAHSRAYQIQVSSNNSDWVAAYTTSTGDGGVDDVTLSAVGRYVRIFSTQRATIWGNSLFEVNVFGDPDPQCAVPEGKLTLTQTSTSGGWVDPAFATDGVIGTAAHKVTSGAEYLEYSLGSTFTLTRARLNEDNAGNWNVDDWKLQFWTGSAWADAFPFTTTPTGSWNEVNFTDVQSDRVRVVVRDTGHVEVRDLEVYGRSGSSTCTMPSPELCNGIDDDCDGRVDESYLCMPAATAASIDDLTTSCPSAAVLAAIDEDLDIRFDFIDADGVRIGNDPAPMGNTLRCTAAAGSRDLTQSQERIYQALIALRAIDFDAPLPFTSKNLYAWLADTIDGFDVRSDVTGSFCCTSIGGPNTEYVTLQNDANRSFYASDYWSNGSLGLFDLVQLIVHEARHAEGPAHCAGGGDESLSVMGSWAAVYYFSRALAFDSDACFLRPAQQPALPSDHYLTQALNYSRTVHSTRFCNEPSVPVEPPEPVFACAN